MNVPSVREVCKPREDILSGDQTRDLYAAKLDDVVNERGPEVYRDPEVFFTNTYATQGLQTTVQEVFKRLVDKDARTPFIKLETGLGGGKTHTLIALYHLAKYGSASAPQRIRGDLEFDPIRVSAVVGSTMGVTKRKDGPSTLWGEIATQLGRYEVVQDADESMTAPGEDTLREMFGEEKTLVLIDEIALYLTKASGVEVQASTLAKQTVAFLMELTEVASSLDNVSIVLTSLNKQTVFGDKTAEVDKALDEDVQEAHAREAVKEAEEVLSRKVLNLTPTKSEEFASVVRHRLFETVNRSKAGDVCEAYYQSLTDAAVADYVPQRAKDAQYMTYLRESYPFHPELIQILRTKTASNPNFNQTRGVLRLLGQIVHHLWEDDVDTPLIHSYHVDLRLPDIREELISRLDRSEYKPAVTADLADERATPRASIVDEGFDEPYGTWTATTVFLHSLTGQVGADIQKGANEADLHLALHRPGLDPKLVENAIKGLEENCFFLSVRGSTYAFQTEPNLVMLIEKTKDVIEGSQVLHEVHRRIEQMYGGRQLFDPRLFANEPSKVPDDTGKPKLVVPDFTECTTEGSGTPPTLVQTMYDKTGTQGKPRTFVNNVVFLVADEDEVDKMRVKSREFLALKKLIEDYEAGAASVQELSERQRSRLKEKRQEAELYLKVAVILAHKHLFIPTTVKSLDTPQKSKPLRHLQIRASDTEVERRVKSSDPEERYLVNFLRKNKAAMTADDNPWAPDYVLDQLWPKNEEGQDGDEFRKMFYKRPEAGLFFTDELIRKTLKEGVKDGKWYAVKGDTLFEQDNAQTLVPSFDSELEIVLINTELGQRIHEQFHKPEEEPEPKPEPGPEGPTPEPEPEPVRAIKVPEKTIQGIVTVFETELDDKEVGTVTKLTLRPRDRDGLSKLNSALPQFHANDMTFNIEATLSRRFEGGNHMRIEYQGNRDGFKKLKPVFIDYEGDQPFDRCQIELAFSWNDGLDAATFLTRLKDDVGPFLGDCVFSATVVPETDEGEAE